MGDMYQYKNTLTLHTQTCQLPMTIPTHIVIMAAVIFLQKGAVTFCSCDSGDQGQKLFTLFLFFLFFCCKPMMTKTPNLIPTKHHKGLAKKIKTALNWHESRKACRYSQWAWWQVKSQFVCVSIISVCIFIAMKDERIFQLQKKKKTHLKKVSISAIRKKKNNLEGQVTQEPYMGQVAIYSSATSVARPLLHHYRTVWILCNFIF